MKGALSCIVATVAFGMVRRICAEAKHGRLISLWCCSLVKVRLASLSPSGLLGAPGNGLSPVCYQTWLNLSVLCRVWTNQMCAGELSPPAA